MRVRAALSLINQVLDEKLSQLEGSVSPDTRFCVEWFKQYGFDDGPNCSHNAFYDFLSSQNQKATFFYIGSNVMDWPLKAQRAIADGHEICAREC